MIFGIFVDQPFSMPFRLSRLAAMAALCGGLFGIPWMSPAADPSVDAQGIAFFENKIRPQLADHCYECHSSTSKKVGGSLRLDTRQDLMRGGDSGAAIALGQPEQSRLLKAIRQVDPDSAMPPAKDGRKKLSDAVIADFARWIQMGAPFPESAVASGGGAAKDGKNHWAFQPVKDPSLPKVRDAAWLKTSVDHFILASLEGQKQRPAPAADRRTLLRRAAFDLTGLPPTMEDTEAFLSDTSPDAYAKAVERLLNSPRYGERWGRHWLDVVRYADTAGETADYPVPVAWRYRNYVIDAFNADKPYDQFLREQIAGDILAREGSREQYAEKVTATGYLAISRRFGFDVENYHHLTIQDTIDTIGQNVMGLSLGCARCHAHKYDPISTADYYGMYGIFDSTRYAFPGSEQKQRHRSMVPLVPLDEALPRWQSFEARVATLAAKLQSANQSPPSAVLSSLTDMDGDFEMQAIAAGGSKGVLVPPWVYEGSVAVTTSAQSPFKNLHALGKVGASVASGTNVYRVAQTLYVPPSTSGLLHFNIDFRAATNAATDAATHRVRLGSQRVSETDVPEPRVASAAVELAIARDRVCLRVADRWETLRMLPGQQWQNLQLTLDVGRRMVRGKLGAPGDVVEFESRPMLPGWTGVLDFVEVASGAPLASGPGSKQDAGVGSVAYAGMEFDNLGIQQPELAPVTTRVELAGATGPGTDAQTVAKQLAELAGLDGDFELQQDDTPPGTPWGPGPNSVVRMRKASQSPFTHIYPLGQVGIHMPNSGAYNGFGQTLAVRRQPAETPRVGVSFDFRCVNQDAGGNGSWRYYIGHGPGSSAAIELYFTGSQFFRRSGDARDVVQPLKLGEWYHVRLDLALREKTYIGSITAKGGATTEFKGTFATGWDGTLDYTFIDSYGHIGGVKPALDADNFAIEPGPLPELNATAADVAVGSAKVRRETIAELKRRQEVIATEAEQAKRELNALLADGPYPLAYAVSEGTPRNARIQQRGEPEKLGDEVPRGFIESIGGGPLPRRTRGSGRLEFAEWLTNPSHPLTARVMVNRIWLQHFGMGLVKTPNDFGVRGQRPTHPELLDHLAVHFVRNGWSIKALHRLILLSATYQQQSVSTELDSVYASFPRRRLSAEEIRDSILWASGELDPTRGEGHTFPSPVSWGYSQHGPFGAVYDHNKRSVYLMTQRIRRHPFLALFDGADPNASTPERRITTVPTQALFFLNDPFVHAKAEKFAARFIHGCVDDAQRVDAGYRLALGRLPTDAERTEAMEFLTAYRNELTAAKVAKPEEAVWSAYARVLFGNNEFLHVD